MTVLLITMAALLAGCSSDEEPPEPVPEPVDASADHRGDVVTEHTSSASSKDAGTDGSE